MLKAFKYRLYPTQPQARDLEHTLALCRQLYNAALQERRDAYSKARKSVGLKEQKSCLPEIRAELPEYKRVHSQVLQNVVERVDKAFRGFFRRVKEGKKPGYPRFKGRGRYDSFTFPQAEVTGVKLQEGGRRVLIYGIGSVKLKLHRPLEGGIKTATVKKEGNCWCVVFVCEMEPKPLPESEKAVGIDLGTNPNFLITSEGEMVEAPRYFHKVQKKLANAQRNLTRKKRGSHRRKQARRRVARLHRKVANQRRDFHHKLARSLVNRYGTIVHEDLNILGLARSNTAKGVQDAGWAQFLQILAYKAAEAGRRVIGVDPRHTSQDCPVCGHREKRPLWIREYTCPQCGTPLHRDVAAAQNVLARARTEPSGTETARAAPLCPRSPALKSGESSREREDGLLCRAEPTQENAWAFWLAAWRFESQVALDLGMRRANLERAFAALKERLPELPGSLLERSREAEDWGKEELRAFRRGE